MVRGIGPLDSDDELLDLSFLEVSARARRAADEEQAARAELEENRRLDAPRLYSSLRDGVDLSFVLNLAESWRALQEELRGAGEVGLGDLPQQRREHWRGLLGEAARRPAPAVGEASRTPQPIVREHVLPRRTPPRLPPKRRSDRT